MSWIRAVLLCAVASAPLLVEAGSLSRSRRQDVNVDSGEWVNPSSGKKLEDADTFTSNLESTRNRLQQEGRKPVSWSDRIDRIRQQVRGTSNNRRVNSDNDDGSSLSAIRAAAAAAKSTSNDDNGNRAATKVNSNGSSSGTTKTNGNGNRNGNGRTSSNQYRDDDDDDYYYSNRGRYNSYDGDIDSEYIPARGGVRTSYRNTDTTSGSSSSSGGISSAFSSGFFGSGMIGGFINSLGQGLANAVQGVSRALANKWETKVDAFRNIATNSIRAGLAHPRFAYEAAQNVFGGF